MAGTLDEDRSSVLGDELRRLAGRIAEAGGLAERLVQDSVVALVRIDTERALQVIADDERLDQMQRALDEAATQLIAEAHPTGKDLRELIAALRVSRDLERVGDLAKNTAKRVLALDGQFHSRRLVYGVEHIAAIALEQLKRVLDAFTSQDLAVAHAVRDRDEEVDAIYTSLFRELLTSMTEDSASVAVCTHMIFCAKNIERIGDHATNIAEEIHFMVTGEHIAQPRQKRDMSSFISAEIFKQ